MFSVEYCSPVNLQTRVVLGNVPGGNSVPIGRVIPVSPPAFPSVSASACDHLCFV